MSGRIEVWSGDRVMIPFWGGWELLLFAGCDEGIVIGIEVDWGTRKHPSLFLRVMSFGFSLFRRSPPDPLFSRRVRTKRTQETK